MLTKPQVYSPEIKLCHLDEIKVDQVNRKVIFSQAALSM